MSTPPTTVFWPGLPNLLDTADGSTKYPAFNSQTGTPAITVGTAEQPGQVSVGAANGSVTIEGIQIEELDDSPELERAEQATSVKRFKMPYNTGVFLISYLGRGVILQDNENRQVRILSTHIQRQKPRMCIFTVVSEGLSFDLPPDEFDIDPLELGAWILKYPRYFYNLLPQPGDTIEQQQIKQALVRAVQTYQDSPFFPSGSGNAINGLLMGQIQANIASQLKLGSAVITIPNINFDPKKTVTPDFDSNNNPSWSIQTYGSVAYPPAGGMLNPVNILVAVQVASLNDPIIQAAYAATQEIINKLWRVEDTPYIVALQMHWTTYNFTKPFYNPGGYLENPIADTNLLNPGLPAYFGSVSFDYTKDTIFDKIALINPQCYSSDGTVNGKTQISWLRKADVMEYQRTWFRTTRTWLGAVSGHFDSDFYNRNARPGPSNYPGPAFGYNLLA